MKQLNINSLIQNNLPANRALGRFKIEELENIKHFYKPDVNKLLNELFKEIYSDAILKEMINGPSIVLKYL